jgi:hypothetical protein
MITSGAPQACTQRTNSSSATPTISAAHSNRFMIFPLYQ